MRTVLALLLVAACSKTSKPGDKAAPAPAAPAVAPIPATTAAAPTAAAKPAEAAGPQHVLDPKDLPAAGTAPPAHDVTKEVASIWNAPIKTLQGQPTTLASFKGKALLLVNVASFCGNTPQYAALEAIQKKYGPKGFSVVGFPCNQFGQQEPGSPDDIHKFCTMTYGVTFPLMEKIDVNGANQHAIYKALETVPDAKGHTGDIRWNFEKFVISADGKHITRFPPGEKPDTPEVIAAVEAALPKS